LKAPIGLALAGKSPWEIAVSVIGEIVQTARSREDAEAWPAPAPASDEPGLHALVFAAGEGSRYGGAKLLAPWADGCVLDGALAAAFAAPARTITVVTGAHAHAVAAAARAFATARGLEARLRIVHAPDHTQGLSASIRAGVAALPSDAGGAFLFLGDMPRAPHAVLAPLAAALREGAQAAAPCFAGRRGHPVLVSGALLPRLLVLQGDRGAGELLQSLGAGVVLVEAPDDGVCFDVDEPGDLAGQPSPNHAVPIAL
jgi:molybdenum cofactor cytidylyltransferase